MADVLKRVFQYNKIQEQVDVYLPPVLSAIVTDYAEPPVPQPRNKHYQKQTLVLEADRIGFGMAMLGLGLILVVSFAIVLPLVLAYGSSPHSQIHDGTSAP